MVGRTGRGGGRGIAAHLLSVFVSISAAVGQDTPQDLIEVTGTVVVEDGHGGTVTDASGTILLGVCEGAMWGWQKIFLIDGEWKVRVVAGSQLSFEVFALEDGIAYRVGSGGESAKYGRDAWHDEELSIPPDRRLAIRVRYAPPCLLYIVDKETNAELHGVELVRVSPLPRIGPEMLNISLKLPPLEQRSIHPPESLLSNVQLEEAKSPVTFTIDAEPSTPPIRIWTQRVWVRAPEHCWADVSVDLRKGGEQSVQLPLSGRLDVKTAGAMLPRATRVVIRDPKIAVDDFKYQPLLEWKFRPDIPTTFNGIPAGKYRVTLELGDWAEGNFECFAECQVEVKSGSTALAQLTVEKAPTKPTPIRVTGVIRIAPEWGDADFSVVIIPVKVSALAAQEPLRIDREDLSRDLGETGVWRLPERALAPGTYRIDISNFGIQHLWSVDRSALPIVIEIGPPVDATFRFTDAKSTSPVVLQRVGWLVADEAMDAYNEWCDWHFGPTASSGAFSFRVPAGRIALSTHGGGYDSFGENVVEVSADHADITVPLRHVTGIHVFFQFDGRRVTWKEALHGLKVADDRFEFSDYRPALMSRDFVSEATRDDFVTRQGVLRGTRYFAVKSPGEYRVTFPPIQGYQPIEPRDVTIVDQELTEVVIDLDRQ